MNKEELLEQAKDLYVADEKAFDEYNQKMILIVAEMNKKMLNRSDINELVGADNLQMMEDNHANHARFMASMLREYQPAVFVETILWVFRAYRSRNFATSYWAAQLNTWITVLEDMLTDHSFQKISTLYYWMQINIPSFVDCSDKKLESEFSMH